MALITNSNTLGSTFTPSAAGLFRATAIGGSVVLETSLDSGTSWAPCGGSFTGAVDVNNIATGTQYRFVASNGNPAVRADQ